MRIEDGFHWFFILIPDKAVLICVSLNFVIISILYVKINCTLQPQIIQKSNN